MKCSKCGAENNEDDGFCCECGAKLEKPKSQGNAGEGLSMGDKNVIAGDVNNTVTNSTDYNVAGNATFVKNETTVNNIVDESKKLSVCVVCGKNVLVSDGFTCPKCSRFVCQFHYNAQKRCCADCAEAEEKAAQKQIEFAEKQKQLENERKIEEHNAALKNYEKIVLDCFNNEIITPEIQRKLMEAKNAGGIADSEASEIEKRCISMKHILKQVGADTFAAMGEKSSVAVNNCTFAFDKTSFKINVQSITNNSFWKTGNLALSIWFSPNGPFKGDLSGCTTMAATDLPSFPAGATLNNIARTSQFLGNPPSGTYTPFFAVGEKFTDGIKIISFGNFNPMNWNQR